MGVRALDFRKNTVHLRALFQSPDKILMRNWYLVFNESRDFFFFKSY